MRRALYDVNSAFDRVAMHAVRRELLEAQARSAGLPLEVIPIPNPCPNEVYEAAMGAFVAAARGRGITHFAFGDLFLEDIRRYREQKLAGTGIEPIFPLWGLPTGALAREMIAGGLRAYLTCVDPKQAPREWAGRSFDRAAGRLHAGGGRSLRRARRVPHLRLGRADVRAAGRGAGRRGGGARRLRVRRPAALAS